MTVQLLILISTSGLSPVPVPDAGDGGGIDVRPLCVKSGAIIESHKLVTSHDIYFFIFFVSL